MEQTTSSNEVSDNRLQEDSDVGHLLLLYERSVEHGNTAVEYCPTDCKDTDHMSRPLHDEQWLLFNDMTMGRCGVKDVSILHQRSVLEIVKLSKSRLSQVSIGSRTDGAKTDGPSWIGHIGISLARSHFGSRRMSKALYG